VRSSTGISEKDAQTTVAKATVFTVRCAGLQKEMDEAAVILTAITVITE
jgi:hypothetical protein